MLRDLLKNYRVDVILVLLLSALALVASVFGHAEVKPITRMFAFIGPVIFAVTVMLIVVAMSLTPRYALAARARRPLISFAAVSVFVSVALFKAELFYAPVAWYIGTPPEAVVAQIAADDDVERFKAWSRIVSLNEDQKNDVATRLARLLTGQDLRAERSAALTLDYVLRRHTITTLIALAPELRRYLDAKAAGFSPESVDQRAAVFTSTFVQSGYKNILKALTPKQRYKLPPGGVDALFLALATNDSVGAIFLRGFADQGDDELKAKAQETLALAAAH